MNKRFVDNQHHIRIIFHQSRNFFQTPDSSVRIIGVTNKHQIGMFGNMLHIHLPDELDMMVIQGTCIFVLRKRRDRYQRTITGKSMSHHIEQFRSPVSDQNLFGSKPVAGSSHLTERTGIRFRIMKNTFEMCTQKITQGTGIRFIPDICRKVRFYLHLRFIKVIPMSVNHSYKNKVE